jgi:hyperosmotically inducible protein
MNINIKIKSSFLAIALLASSQSFAMDAVTSNTNQTAYSNGFKSLDSNADGNLSKSEASKEKLFSKHFSSADTNNDGLLNEEEYTNYRRHSEEKNVKRALSDTMVTSKVKGNLLKDEGLKSMKVHVKTHQGVVILSGFVDTNEQVSHAGEIASNTEGVNSVKNSLLIKKE